MRRAAVFVIGFLLATSTARADDGLALHAHATPPSDDIDATLAAMIAGMMAPKPPEPPPTGRGEFDEHVESDGTMHVVDGPNVRFGPRRGPPDPNPAGVTILSFDVSDAFMRHHGIDPYASAKLRALDSTRAARVAQGLAHRAHQLGKTGTAAAVDANLAHVFATIREPAAQAEALAELWQDCATTGSTELVAAGAYARWLIEATAREHGLVLNIR